MYFAAQKQESSHESSMEYVDSNESIGQLRSPPQHKAGSQSSGSQMLPETFNQKVLDASAFRIFMWIAPSNECGEISNLHLHPPRSMLEQSYLQRERTPGNQRPCVVFWCSRPSFLLFLLRPQQIPPAKGYRVLQTKNIVQQENEHRSVQGDDNALATILIHYQGPQASQRMPISKFRTVQALAFPKTTRTKTETQVFKAICSSSQQKKKILDLGDHEIQRQRSNNSFKLH